MNAEQFLYNVSVENNIFFVSGEEAYLIDKVREAVVKKLACGELNVDFKDENASVEEIISLAEQAPCFAECRIIILTDPALLKNRDSERFAEYLKTMPETTKIMIIARQGVDKRKAIYKYLQKNALMIEADVPDDGVLVKWIAATAKKKNVSLKPAEARLLADVCGRDMYALEREIDKLSMLDKREITKADIENTVSVSNEYSVFLLHTHMMNGRYRDAFELAMEIYADEKTFIPLIALLAGKFEQMLAAKEALVKGESAQGAAAEVSRLLKISPGAARYAVKDSGQFEIEMLKKSVKMLSEYEYALKSGGKDGGIESFLIKLYRKEK